MYCAYNVRIYSTFICVLLAFLYFYGKYMYLVYMDFLLLLGNSISNCGMGQDSLLSLESRNFTLSVKLN